MHLKLWIRALSSLAFSERKPGGNFLASLPYIPGATLRGALAEILLAEMDGEHNHQPPYPEEDCVFCRTFLGSQPAVFRNAYPAHAAEEVVRILPATAQSCKTHPGFPRWPHDDEHHGVFDTLIDDLWWEHGGEPSVPAVPTCPVCAGRVESYGGPYVLHSHDGREAHYHVRRVAQRLLTRVAINRRRMVAEDGLLYSPYVISEVSPRDRHDPHAPKRYAPTCFVGQVRNLPTELRDCFKRIRVVGGRTSQGLGDVQIQTHVVVDDEEGSSWATVQDRITALNQLIGKVGEQLPGAEPIPQGTYFTIDLESDAIFRTLDGMPTMVFDPDLLEAATGGLEAQLMRSYASYSYSGGWNAAWGLPKPAQVVTNAGSCYLFRMSGTLTESDCQALARLEETGIGIRVEEGYGQVRIAHEFHTVRRGANEPRD
jgi:CRISPR-associated protein Csx10